MSINCFPKTRKYFKSISYLDENDDNNEYKLLPLRHEK